MNRLLIFFLFLVSCKENVETRRHEIRRLITSQNKTNIVKGFYLIGESRDTTFIKEITSNLNDPRVTNHLKFKGISVYQAKITAMKKITGVAPPAKITYRPDSTIIKFYIQVAKQKNLLR